MRGHSQVRRCFAWTQCLPAIGKHTVDCIIHAAAYDTVEFSDQPLFTLQHLLYEQAPWPLPPLLKKRMDIILDELNQPIITQ